MLLPVFKSTLLSALLCTVLIVFTSFLYSAGEGHAGIISVYTRYPFFIFGLVGQLFYSVLLFFALYLVGRKAGSSNLGRYISGFIIFVVLLDLCVYPMDPASGVTAVGVMLSQPFSLYTLIPLSFMLIGVAGVLKIRPSLKAISAIFGVTFIMANTMLWM